MKLALRHMLVDLLTLIVAHQLTRRAALAAPGLAARVGRRLAAWRPESFAVWPKQREW